MKKDVSDLVMKNAMDLAASDLRDGIAGYIESIEEALAVAVRHRDCDWCDVLMGDEWYDENDPPGPEDFAKAAKRKKKGAVK